MNKKCMIILTLVASAHVHGMDQNSNTLGKRTRQSETEKNAQNKRQKTTNQAIVEQSNALSDSQDRAIAEPIDTSTQNCAGTTRGHPIQAQDTQLPQYTFPANYTFHTYFPRDLIRLVMEYLGLNKGPELKQLSKLMNDPRKPYRQLWPQKYCDQKGEWVKWKGDDNTDNCFRYFVSTLWVPNKPDVLATLEKIISENNIGQKVNRVIIDLPKLELYKAQWPYGSSRTINKLFTDTENNSVTFKVVSTDTQDFDFDGDISDMMQNLSNVKHLIFEGKTGNERIDLDVPVNMGNQSVTMRNAKLCNLGIWGFTEDRTEGRKERKLSTTTAKGTSELTIENATLKGTATDGMMFEKYYIAFCYGLSSMEALHRFMTEGQSKFTIAQGKVTTQSNVIAAYFYKPEWLDSEREQLNVSEQIRRKRAQYKAIAKGDKSKVILESNGTTTASSDCHVDHFRASNSGNSLYSGEAVGTNAMIRVTPSGHRTLTGDTHVEQNDYVKGSFSAYHTARAEGPNSKVVMNANDTGRAESDGYAWYEKTDKFWAGREFSSDKVEAKGKTEGKAKAEISFERQRNDNTVITKLSASGTTAKVQSQKYRRNKDSRHLLLQDRVAEGTNVQFIDKEDNAIEFKSNKNVSGKEYNEDGVLGREVDVRGSDATLIIEKDGTQTLEGNSKAMFTGYNEAGKMCQTTIAEDSQEANEEERIKPKIIIKDNQINASGTKVKHENDGDNNHPSEPFTKRGNVTFTVAL